MTPIYPLFLISPPVQVFQPYCGADPVKNYSIFGDMIGKRPESDFCHEHYELFSLLFDYLQLKDDDIEDVFWSWITSRSLDEVRGISEAAEVAL